MTPKGKSLFFLCALFVFCGFSIYIINYVIIKNHLENKAKDEIKKATEYASFELNKELNTSIENYLRGITDTQLSILSRLNKDVQNGKLTLEKAKDKYQELVKGLIIGKTGYIVVLEPGEDFIQLAIHPFMRRKNCTPEQLCEKWVEVKNGYSEYNWKNPKEKKLRLKVSYVREFKPWNWLIGGTSYKDEFSKLIDLKKIRKQILARTIKNNGYFSIMDKDFNFLIHPELEKSNAKTIELQTGTNVTNEMKKLEHGFFSYVWKNPSDQSVRKKYLYFEKLPEFGWYLLATVYLEDIYYPVDNLGIATIYIVLLTITGFSLALLNDVRRNGRRK